MSSNSSTTSSSSSESGSSSSDDDSNSSDSSSVVVSNIPALNQGKISVLEFDQPLHFPFPDYIFKVSEHLSDENPFKAAPELFTKCKNLNVRALVDFKRLSNC